MKKKLILAALAASLVLGLTACGGNNSASAPALTEGTLELTEVKDSGLAGLCEYLAGNGTIAGDPLEMKAELIGAKEGRKYGFQFDNTNIVVELYEFDNAHLDETGKAVLDSVREKGTFSLMGKDVQAKLTENGKYLYINSDGTTDKENHIAQNQKLEKLIEDYSKDEPSGKKETGAASKDSSKADKAESKAESQTSSASASEAAESAAQVSSAS